MKKIWIILLCATVMVCGTGCGNGSADAASEEEPVSKEFFAMDTYMTVSAYGQQAGEATEKAEEAVYRLDEMLSTGNAQSEIAKLNENGKATLSQESGALVEKGLELYQETGGKFDIAIYPVMEAWGFTDENYQVPLEVRLQDLLSLTDASQIRYDARKGTVSFQQKGMKIDLGGIAKGYTSAKIMEIYEEHGISSGLVSLGGNVQVLGRKPDGNKWNVAIQSPESTEDYIGVLKAEDTAIITSGGYERNFEKDGILYHHIIDPETGYPAESGLKSVTIVSEDGTLADALSTALFIMGKEQATAFWKARSDQFDAIFMTSDDKLYVTEGIAEDFSSEGYETEIIKK